MAEESILTHVRRYKSGESFSLTQDNIDAGLAFDDIVDEGLANEPYVQASYLAQLDVPADFVLSPCGAQITGNMSGDVPEAIPA